MHGTDRALVIGSGVVLVSIIAFVLLGFIRTAVMTSGERLESADAGEVTMVGTVRNVDFSAEAYDGPGLITAETDSGETFVIATPSAERTLCPALSQLADPNTIVVGDRVAVSGVRNSLGMIKPCAEADHYLTVTATVGAEVPGATFDYRKSPDGYVVLNDTESAHEDFLTGVMLMNREEYVQLMESTDAREGPPALHVRVYANPQKQFPSVWASEHSRETNSNLAFGSMEAVVVGGANGVRFTVDGLYPTNTIVVAHGENLYLLTGSYLDTESSIYRDFEALVESFAFVPLADAAAPQKINPHVACESALAYMTFPSSVEAEAFIASCVAGEHPEVIERYQKEHGPQGALL